MLVFVMVLLVLSLTVLVVSYLEKYEEAKRPRCCFQHKTAFNPFGTSEAEKLST